MVKDRRYLNQIVLEQIKESEWSTEIMEDTIKYARLGILSMPEPLTQQHIDNVSLTGWLPRR